MSTEENLRQELESARKTFNVAATQLARLGIWMTATVHAGAPPELSGVPNVPVLNVRFWKEQAEP